MAGAQGTPTPMVRYGAFLEPGEEYFLDDEMATQFRSIVGSLRYLSETDGKYSSQEESLKPKQTQQITRGSS